MAREPDADCAIEQALAVVGDWWSLLIVRDIASGTHRFDRLQTELDVSRKVLTARLGELVAGGVLDRRPYTDRPPRFEYHLTDAGRALLPVLVALQTWGAQHVLGDGRVTAAAGPRSTESRRVRALVGTRVPALRLPTSTGGTADPISDAPWTVVYAYPGAYAPGDHGYPPGWGAIPGARGCTVEAQTFRDRAADFERLGAAVRGVSTQRPDELGGFADHVGLPYPLLSDADGSLSAGLRLPTFRAGGQQRLKRVTLIVAADRTVARVLYPIPDPAASVGEALAQLTALHRRRAGSRA